jgi:hypothetical protein
MKIPLPSRSFHGKNIFSIKRNTQPLDYSSKKSNQKSSIQKSNFHSISFSASSPTITALTNKIRIELARKKK